MIIAVQQLSALLVLLLGLSFLSNVSLWSRYTRHLQEAPWQGIPLGLILLVVGLLIVIYHNLWLASWTLIITLIGWLFIVKAMILLLLPSLPTVLAGVSEHSIRAAFRISGIAMTAAGAFTCYTLFFG